MKKTTLRNSAIMATTIGLIGSLSFLSLAKNETAKTHKTGNAMTKTTTQSGLGYAILQAGSGVEAKRGQRVTVHYTGWLEKDGEPTGTPFDSSHNRQQPFVFILGGGQVIKGWDEGVAGMKIGEKRRLYIPSQLGYGAYGAGGVIPPNANLIFDVELLGVA